MTSTLIYPLLRWGVGLMIGSFVAYRMRSTLRAAIGYFFPMSKRILPNFFTRLRKYTAIASVFLALLIALVLTLGFNRIFQVETSDAVTLQSSSADLPLDLKDFAPPEAEKEVPFSNSDSVVSSVPAAAPVSTPTVRPTIYDAPTTTNEVVYYLQLGAFRDYTNAIALKQQWTARTSYSVLFATAPDASPHKVILGPFPHLDAARRFRVHHRMTAFPRAASYYHSIQF
ncbi:MAG: SPOR domain-containing protein [Bacteroidota bacterium]